MEQQQTSRPKALGRLVGAFKTLSTNRSRREQYIPTDGVIWQRNFYEHIIRTEKSLLHIRQYIINNPAQWELDRENPHCL